MKKNTISLIAIVCGIIIYSAAYGAGNVRPDVFEDYRVRAADSAATGEFLVKLQEGADEDEVMRKLREQVGPQFQGKRLRTVRVHRVKMPRGFDHARFAKLLQRVPGVEYAEPNSTVYALFTPNDPYYSYQWNMPQIKMPQAWDVAQGEGVIVAVVDTGIAYEDYQEPVTGKIFKIAPDLAGTTFAAGYDFVNDDTHPNDDEGHGTHVAGTIAQTTNNSLGVAGVAYSATLMPVKVLAANGSGTLADVADGIRWAADRGARVINLSLGSSVSSITLRDAVAYAYGKGVTIVAAAGNDGRKKLSYPAAYDSYVIAVGAVRYDKTRSRYSNYGSFVDLVAPGGDTRVDQNSDGYGDGILQQTFASGNPQLFGYYFYQGTSMATPHVSAAAALLVDTGITDPAQVRARLESTALDLGSKGRDIYYGAGLIDVARALGL